MGFPSTGMATFSIDGKICEFGFAVCTDDDKSTMTIWLEDDDEEQWYAMMEYVIEWGPNELILVPNRKTRPLLLKDLPTREIDNPDSTLGYYVKAVDSGSSDMSSASLSAPDTDDKRLLELNLTVCLRDSFQTLIFAVELEPEPVGENSLSFSQFEMKKDADSKKGEPFDVCWKASKGLVSEGIAINSDRSHEIVVVKTGIYHVQVDGLTDASTKAKFGLYLFHSALRSEKYKTMHPTTFRVAMSLVCRLEAGDDLVFWSSGAARLKSAVMQIRQLSQSASHTPGHIANSAN
ncbi:hypothetical protein PINS_up015285 [Pythium insidiosum]|nr:hypothetical protein PINS_up015285 [Pythium insidiosum]